MAEGFSSQLIVCYVWKRTIGTIESLYWDVSTEESNLLSINKVYTLSGNLRFEFDQEDLTYISDTGLY